MIPRLNSLSGNVVQFCRFLRHKGFSIGTEAEATALKALQFIDFSSIDIFSLCLKVIICRSKNQFDEFDGLFAIYWKELAKAVEAKVKVGPEKKPQLPASQPQFKSLQAWLNGNKNQEVEEIATYSTRENFYQKDFSSVPEDEVEELMQAIKALSKRIAAKASRRYETSHAMHLPDLRHTLRKNLRRGGELLDIVYRKPKKNRVKLVLLCDVSRSMELYTAFLIQFLYAFQQVFNRVETFVFSTALTRITKLLKDNTFSEALNLMSLENSGWSGGTKIGRSLDLFTQEFARKLLDKKTVVVILSDGWDTGDIPLLQKNMELIHSKVRKLIWLNPLAGYVAYQPEASGMKAAMPYTDVFLSVHNVDSLRKLGKHLVD